MRSHRLARITPLRTSQGFGKSSILISSLLRTEEKILQGIWFVTKKESRMRKIVTPKIARARRNTLAHSHAFAHSHALCTTHRMSCTTTPLSASLPPPVTTPYVNRPTRPPYLSRDLSCSHPLSRSHPVWALVNDDNIPEFENIPVRPISLSAPWSFFLLFLINPICKVVSPPIHKFFSQSVR